jgi:putative ABC transport system ATP-binding protein
MAFIEMNMIQKHYVLGDGSKVPILNGIDIAVESGEFVAVMGPSGSGKSTLMNILGTLDRPDSGVYLLDDEDTRLYDEVSLAHLRNKTIGFVFQGFNLLPRRTIIDNIALPLCYGGERYKERIWRAEHYLKQMGLYNYRDYTPSQLSGGQQQRVAIARALVGEPKLLLADEPTGNLDSETSDAIMAILRDLNNEGITMVLVTHDQDVARYAQRLLHVKDGNILYDGPMY